MVYILGINAFHADAASSLLKNGKIVNACEEERITRIKHCAGFPYESIKWCLNDAGITIEDVDHISINTKPRIHLGRKILYSIFTRPDIKFLYKKFIYKKKRFDFTKNLAECFPNEKIKAKIHFVDHHLAHLASAFYVSPFTESSVISVDGFGDFASAAWGKGINSELNIEKKVFFPHSLGIFYTSITQFLGFPNYGDEYKIMGLAPYGKPKYISEMRKLVKINSNGSFELNLKYFRHAKENIPINWENGTPVLGQFFKNEMSSLLGSRRNFNDEIEQRHKDIAHSAQIIYEEALFNLLNFIYSKQRIENLCIAGGCGANSVANGKITKMTKFKNVFVQPAAGDAGGSLGSALFTWHELSKKRSPELKVPFLGPSFSQKKVDEFFNETVLKDIYEKKLDNVRIINIGDDELPEEIDLINLACNLLIQGKVIGWFQGRMEWGPRALGNRSIIGDPRNSEMQNILNSKIKRRESFRPFAPSVLKNHAMDWFEMIDKSDNNVPFMMKVFPIKKEKRNKIPAVCHVDGTGRLQTVSKENNGRYYKLINRFYELTGVPMILNTSFNENEPIVGSISEAYECFKRTKMDALIIENKMLLRT